MVEGAVAQRTVRLENTSDAPLKIERALASCGCTTTRAPKQIAARASAPLTILFDSHSRVGPIRQSVRVYVAGHAAPLIVPTTGQVAREIAFSARSLDLGDGTSRAPAAFTVTRVDGKPLLVSADAPRPLRVRVEQLSSNAARVLVSFAAPALAGVHEEQIALRLNHPGLPTTKVPVMWVTPSVYQTTPEQVNFGVVAPNSARKQQVRVSGPDAAKLRVLSCQGGVRARLDPPRAAGSRQAVLSVAYTPKGGKNSLMRGQIVLATGNARQPRVVIPVYAAIAEDQPCAVP